MLFFVCSCLLDWRTFQPGGRGIDPADVSSNMRLSGSTHGLHLQPLRTRRAMPICVF
jgi:hypothetical protein